MATEAARLVKLIQKKIAEFKDVCKGIDEDVASSAPDGNWTPKQIVSHLCGPEGEGYIASIIAFLEKDTPRLDIRPADHFYTEKRARMTMNQMLSELENEYNRIAGLTAGLTDDQLARKAHIPVMKNTPTGEYPTLAEWIRAIMDYHFDFHIEQMHDTLQRRPFRSVRFWK